MNTAINNLTIQNVLSIVVTELVASTASAAGKVALFLPLLAKIF
jgi:hypothetical protein